MIISKYFKALSDETRLRLFNILIHFEFNVNELVQIMDMGQSRISRHLKIMTDTQLLSSRRNGSYVYYHAVIDKENQKLIEFIEQSAKKYAELQEDLVRSENIFKERKNKTRQFFNNVAKYWDSLKEEVFGDLDLNRIIKSKISPVETLVDLGCGTGELLFQLQDTASKLLGVDSSPKMLEQARKKLGQSHQGLNLRLGEMEHLPLSDQEADLAFLNMVLHHLPLPEAGIREVSRVLKKDGLFIITDFAAHDQEEIREKYGGPWLGFKKEKIKQWLFDAGFSLKEFQSYSVKKGLQIQLFVSQKGN